MSMHNNNGDLLSTLFVSSRRKDWGGCICRNDILAAFWLTSIKPFSDVAAVFAPILGCIYLSLQIGVVTLGQDKERGLT